MLASIGSPLPVIGSRARPPDSRRAAPPVTLILPVLRQAPVRGSVKILSSVSDML